MYGTQCHGAALAVLLIGLFSAYVVIPVFHKLQLISSYEYIELRFGHGVRIVLSALFTIFTLMYMPLVMHGVAMAVNQVTGVEDLWITLMVSSVCIIYTTLGGLKAVVWTDTIQGVLMIVSTSVILVVGTVRAGGVTKVLSTASAAGRIEIFNFDPDPTVRLTFWSSVFGMGLQRFVLAFSPESIQRFTSLSSLRDAQKASLILVAGIIFFATISLLSGILVSAQFVSCDPLTSGLIKRPDQILPFFVGEVFWGTSEVCLGCSWLELFALH
uniref:Sodium-coupled monocarboxylate transporter 2 n=1 Tax=Lygus hesperus TaxID=30085 RepID=A0A0A9XZQ7_LYGHE